MNFNRYQAESKRTMKEGRTLQENVSDYSMGLAGEAGEVIDYLKKVLHHDHDLDVEEIKKELGDLLWYMSALATTFDINMNQVAQMNIDKLKKRYPVGFSAADSVKRVDVTITSKS